LIASEGGPRYAGVFRIGLSIAASIARHSEFAPSALSSWTWCSSTSATPRAPHIAGRAAMLMTKLVRCSRHPYVLRTQTHVAASASEAGHIRRPVRRSGAACVSRESIKAMGTRRGGVHMPANQVTGSACTGLRSDGRIARGRLTACRKQLKLATTPGCDEPQNITDTARCTTMAALE